MMERDDAFAETSDTEGLATAVMVEEVVFGTFHLGSGEFAIETSRVREVVSFPEVLTPVPLAATSVLGLFSLRGEVLPVLDLAEILKVDRTLDPIDCCVAVLDCGGGHVGVLFERTGEVLRRDPSEVHTMQHASQAKGMVVVGALQVEGAERFVQILSPELVGSMPGVPECPARDREERVVDTRSYGTALVMRVGEHRFGVPMEDILEIHDLEEITPTPDYFSHCTGVVYARGVARGVLDFRSALGLSPAEPGVGKFVFLLDDGACIALQVDALEATIEYPEDDLLDMPDLPDSDLAYLFRQVLPDANGEHILFLRSQKVFERYEVHTGIGIINRGAENEAENVENLEEEVSYLTFFVGEQFFGVSMEDTREVQELPDELIPSGTETDAIMGVMDLRGDLVPLVHAGELMQIPGSDRSSGRIVIIVEQGERRRGLVVDQVHHILRACPSDLAGAKHILEMNAELDGVLDFFEHASVLSGDPDPHLDDRLIVMLDPAKLLRPLGSRDA